MWANKGGRVNPEPLTLDPVDKKTADVDYYRPYVSIYTSTPRWKEAEWRETRAVRTCAETNMTGDEG